MADRSLFGRAVTGTAPPIPEAEETASPGTDGVPIHTGSPNIQLPDEDDNGLADILPIPEATENAVPEATEEAPPEAAEQTAPEETEQTAPEAAETAAPETTEQTLAPTAVPAAGTDQDNGSGLAGLGSPWLVLALAAAVIGLLAANIAQLLRGRRRVRPGVRVGRLHAQGARQYQQDCLAVSDPAKVSSRGLMAVVADGMGGLSDGDKVSAAAVEAALGAFSASSGAEPPEQLLLAAAQKAVQAVNKLLGPENYRKSGTTLLLGLIRGGKFFYLSVGDSHIYLLRDGGLALLNREHVFANELALRAVNGETALEDPFRDSRRGGLVSYLGMGPLKYVDLPAEPVQIVPGDKFILMSDGVYNALEAGELRDALAGSPEQAADRLGKAIAAKAYANQDNYTAVILECGPEK